MFLTLRKRRAGAGEDGGWKEESELSSIRSWSGLLLLFSSRSSESESGSESGSEVNGDGDSEWIELDDSDGVGEMVGFSVLLVCSVRASAAVAVGDEQFACPPEMDSGGALVLFSTLATIGSGAIAVGDEQLTCPPSMDSGGVSVLFSKRATTGSGAIAVGGRGLVKKELSVFRLSSSKDCFEEPRFEV